MAAMTAGITKAGTGMDGIVWNILGQTYRPKQLTERSFAWHATLPADTFVPPHIHPTQDEYVYVLDGLFNRSSATVVCLFWVTPTARLYDLFVAIDALADQTPEAVVALAAEHDVQFLPPPEA